MSASKGFLTQKRTDRQELFQNYDKVAGDRAASISSIKLPYPLIGANLAIVSIDAKTKIIEITGHSLRDLNDHLKIMNGVAQDIELYPLEIIDANNIRVAEIPAGLLVGDEVLPHRLASLKMNSDGDLVVSSGPIQFIKNGVTVNVSEDTVVPANNVPLLVKLASITGDINITANDLNVQLQHTGANPDSTQIGDGVEILEIYADGSAQVRDQDAIDELLNILAVLPATLGQKASANSLAVVLSTEQEAKVDLLATEATLAALSAKLNSLGQKASAASAPVVLSTEQEAVLDNIDTNTANIDAKLGSLGQKATAGSAPVVLSSEQEAILSSIDTNTANLDAKLGSLGQKASAASAPVVLSTEQEAKIDLIAREATLAALSAKLNSLGQKASAASAPVVLSSEQELLIDDIITLLTSMDTELTSIYTNTFNAETILTSIDGKIPVTGQATMANSTPVTIASDQSDVPVAVVRNTTADVFSSALIDTTPVTFTPTGNPVKVMVQADEGNTVNLRIGMGGTTPTAALGWKLLPGASEIFEFAGAIEIRSESGSNQGVNVIFLGRV